MPKTTTSRGSTVNFRVGPRLKQTIKDYAEAREMPVGEFVRYCVLLYMDTTPTDPNEDLSAPSDLSDEEQEAIAGTLELGEVRRG